MASITTNPNANIVNIFPFPNIITSATGGSSNTAAAVAAIQTYINTTNAAITVNSLSAYSGSNVTVNNNLLLSNSAFYINNTSRFNAAGLGIGTTNPVATLDVVGSALVRGQLNVSTNIYVYDSVYASNVVYPSDATLKRDIQPYMPSSGSIEPVRFTWKSSGASDIGVIAQVVWRVEPACVHSTSSGTLGVDYAKLVVVCLAELRDLRSTVRGLEARLDTI